MDAGMPPTLANLKIEQAFLGTLLATPKTIETLPHGFTADVFAFEGHAEIFQAITALAQAGEPDSFAVANACRGLGIEASYIAGLTNAMVSPRSVPTHAAALIDLWRRRGMVMVAQKIIERANVSGGELPAPTILSEAIGELDALAANAVQKKTAFSLAEAMAAAIEAGERAAAGAEGTLRTGFRDIDAAVGALEPGALYVLAGRPGMGKTALGVQVALNMALDGHKSFYCSLEMQAAQIGRRALSYLSGVPLHVLKSGRLHASQAEDVIRAQRKINNVSLTIDEQAGISTSLIGLKARAARRSMNGLATIFVDHMHIVSPDAAAERNGATRATEKISSDLKRLAGDMGVPVIALAQLNRGVEGREDKRPTLSDLRQSGAIEQDAEAVLLLYRHEYYLAKGEPERSAGQSAAQFEKVLAELRDAKDRAAGRAELIIAKLRDGEPGTISLTFDGARTTFGDKK